MLFTLLLFASYALADFDVQVGLDNSLRFSPETIFAPIGALVNFHFHSDSHTASESTARLRDPCNTEGGFDTGVQSDGSTQSIIISTHNSIYVHCAPHCHQGMVMIVNPGPNDSVETFRSAAIAAGGGNPSSPPPPSPPPPPPPSPPPPSSTTSPLPASSQVKPQDSSIPVSSPQTSLTSSSQTSPSSSPTSSIQSSSTISNVTKSNVPTSNVPSSTPTPASSLRSTSPSLLLIIAFALAAFLNAAAAMG